MSNKHTPISGRLVWGGTGVSVTRDDMNFDLYDAACGGLTKCARCGMYKDAYSFPGVRFDNSTLTFEDMVRTMCVCFECTDNGQIRV